MAGSAEEALSSVDRAVADAQQRAVEARRFSEELDQVRVVGQSRDGAAEVTLTHTGALTDIYLGRRLEDASLDKIRSSILEASVAAQGQLADRVSALAGQAFGNESGTTRELVRQYADLFPPAPPDEDGPHTSGVLR